MIKGTYLAPKKIILRWTIELNVSQNAKDSRRKQKNDVMTLFLKIQKALNIREKKSTNLTLPKWITNGYQKTPLRT